MHLLLSSGVVLLASQASSQTFLVSKGAGQIGKTPKEYQPAVVKQSYPVGWWAKTGASSLDVEFSPGNTFALLPESEAEISDNPSAKGSGLNRKVSLKAGKITLKLNGAGKKNIEVETPTAICGAVGTVFEVNAATSNFNIVSGAVYLVSTKDQTFRGDAISGNVTVGTGVDNTAVSGTVSGKFAINGETMVARGSNFEVAKADGAPSPAALEVSKAMPTPNATWEITTQPTVVNAEATTEVVKGSIPAGSYIMTPNSNKLVKVTDAETKAIHREYRAAAKVEGQLAVKQRMYKAAKMKSPAGLDGQVKAAAKRATDLRKKLFQRSVIRNVAKQVVRRVSR